MTITFDTHTYLNGQDGHLYLQVETAQELKDALDLLLPQTNIAQAAILETAPVTEEKPEIKKPQTKKPDPERLTAEPTTPKSSPEPENVSDATQPAPELSYDDLWAKAQEAMALRPKLVALLVHYKALNPKKQPSLKHVKPEDYLAFMADIDKIVAGTYTLEEGESDES